MKKQWKALIDGRDMDNDEIIDAIFEQRNIDNIIDFLTPKASALISCDALKNINQAWYKLSVALDNNKHIKILADVDVDGCTSGSIMYRYLSHFTDNISITINDGKEHGIENYDVENCNADLIIIVDSINKSDEYNKFIEHGKTVIVLDHHILPDEYETYSHISLVSSAYEYPNPQLSGAGVVWKFCKYCDDMWLTDYADKYIDLAATGIIADMMDMSVPENRYICYTGLKNLNNTGIKSIVGSYEFNSQSVSFSIAPMINACNRMMRNELALQIFLTDDEEEAKTLVKKMKDVREEQNNLVDNLMPDLIKQAESQINNKVLFFSKVLFFFIDTEFGVSGLLGNKLLDLYQRPVFVLKSVDDEYRGSMRACGIDNFAEMVNDTGLAKCEGHELASGFVVNKGKFLKFAKVINERLANVEFEEQVIADIQLDISQINKQLIANFKAIDFLSGTGAKPLTVMITGINEYSVGNMSKGKHLKLVTDYALVIKWNYTNNFDEFDDGANIVDVIGTLNSGYFGKTFYNQVIIDEYKVRNEES